VSDNKFWAIVWGYVGTIILSIVLSLALNEAYEDSLVAEAIRVGIEPMKVRCAFSDYDKTQCAFPYLIEGAK